MTIDQEAAKWSQQADDAADKYLEEVKGLVHAGAAMGHHKPPGEIQWGIVNLGQKLKGALTAVNGEIYKTAVTWLSKIDEVDAKVAIGLAKLDLSDYAAALDNQKKVDRATAELDLDKRKADLERLKSTIEARQAAIIEERARTEAEIVYWKTLQVQAEGLSLDAEIDLINAKVATAQAKLTILPDLYAVIAAEQLVVAAELRRADALELVLVAEQNLAAVKETMIPLYEDKAAKRIEQATAITQEAEVKRKIEELGYEKIDLKNYEEEAEHQIRYANLVFEQWQTKRRESEIFLERVRAIARTTITEHENVVRAAIITAKEQLEKDDKNYQLWLRWFWTQYDVLNRIALMELDKELYLVEKKDKTDMIFVKAKDDCRTVQESAVKEHKAEKMITDFRYIKKG